MAQTLHVPHATDDRLWTWATVALAGLSVILTVAGGYDPAAVVGLLGVLAGGWAMLISRTRTERFEVVTATVVAAVALAVSLAYGSGLPG